jgi:hypothetical protein
VSLFVCSSSYCRNLVIVSMLQMAEPDTDSYDDERDGELLIALFVVDIWGSSPSGVCRRTMVETGIQWVERTL